jgi:transposase
VVLTLANAPWHRGKLIDEALADNPHLEFYRLPRYSPNLNVIERFWKKLWRRATYNRLFDTIADLKRHFSLIPTAVQSSEHDCMGTELAAEAGLSRVFR